MSAARLDRAVTGRLIIAARERSPRRLICLMVTAIRQDLGLHERVRQLSVAPGSTRGPIGSKLRSVNRRPATGRSFFIMIALACIATALVIAWTVRSSEPKRGHAGPSGLRM